MEILSLCEKIQKVMRFFNMSRTPLISALQISNERFCYNDTKTVNETLLPHHIERLNIMFNIVCKFESVFPDGIAHPELFTKFMYDNASIMDAFKRDEIYQIEIENMLWKIAYSKDKIDMKNFIRLHWCEEFENLGYAQKSYEEQMENLQDHMQRLRLRGQIL